jgi:DnaK suppressor protein
MMPKEKLEKFKKLLLEEKIRILEGLMEDSEEFSSLNNTSDMGDLVDQANKYQEKEYLINLSQNEQKTLKLIDAALKRIESGAYGYCIETGKPIDEKRLEAIPYAELCMEAKSKKMKLQKKVNL